MKRLDNKVVVVTGGAGLIGRSYCQAIYENGGIPVIADLNLEQAEAAAKNIGGHVVAAHLDITNTISVQRLLEDLFQRFDRVDGLVNNAYPRNDNYGRGVEAVEVADFNENLSLHLGGYFLMMQKYCLAIKERGQGGSIVNMSSIYGVVAPKFEIYEGTAMTTPVEYAAIKSGVIHLTKYFARYYLNQGIRVNAMSPGGIEDGQPDEFLKKYNANCGSTGMLSPNDLSQSLVFLLSSDSKHMTGQNLVVDDGFTL